MKFRSTSANVPKVKPSFSSKNGTFICFAVLEKLERRLETVKVNILNPPRPGKKLLVVDIDYTIFDLGSSAERPEELARPYLHVFFAACYEYFDLMIWSATSMKWVEIKMRVFKKHSLTDLDVFVGAWRVKQSEL